MSVPVVSPSKLSEVQDYFYQQGKFRDLTSTDSEVESISTDCPSLDYITGIGGFPRGRIVEISGAESSGKSTLALALCQLELSRYPDVFCVYWDYERSTAKKYAASLGLTQPGIVERFHLLDGDTLEDADNGMRVYFQKGAYPDIVVVDSVAAMTPESELTRDADKDPQVAAQARKMGPLMDRWAKAAAAHGTCFILVNQLRTYISTSKYDQQKGIPGVAGSDKELTPGGKALRYYASMRIRLDVRKIIKAQVFNPMIAEKEEIPVANVVRATCWKNKVAAPYRSGLFHIEFGKGIDNARTLMELGTKSKIITRSGSWYSVKTEAGEIREQGEKSFVEKMKSSPDILDCVAREVGYLAGAEDKGLDSGERVEIDIEKGTTTQLSELHAVKESGVTPDLIEKQESLTQKADLLMLIEKGPKGVEWDGVKASSLATLQKKLEKDQATMELLEQQFKDRFSVFKDLHGEGNE